MSEEEAMTHEQKRRWIKYYCEECKAWETREMFEVGGAATALWSWGCTQLVRHAAFQTFKVQDLNSADGHDAAPKLDFPEAAAAAASPASTEPVVHEQVRIPEEVQTVVSQSNGSSQQSKQRSKRNVRSAFATTEATSAVNSQGGVTSSSLPPGAENEVENNGASTIAAAAAVPVKKPQPKKPGAKESGRASAPESPAVIDAEHHENGVHKRPRRITAGDRYLAQSLQYEKPARAAPKQASAEVSQDVKPSQSSLEMKRSKRVTAGLRGAVLSAENAKTSPSPRVLAKKEQKKETVHEVRTRSEAAAKKPSKKNRKLGDLY